LRVTAWKVHRVQTLVPPNKTTAATKSNK
jgi:hypothetical protein